MKGETPMAVVIERRDLAHLLFLLDRPPISRNCDVCERLRKAAATAQTVAELSGERPL